jgi:hypothetical protein
MTVLTAVTILSGAAAPAVNDYVEQAKRVRVRHDVDTLAVTLMRMANDTPAQAMAPGGWATYDLLVSEGAVPEASGAAAGWTATREDSVGRLDDHLIYNDGRYPRPERYGAFGWRGPYLQQTVAADPWGIRYGVNVHAMRTPDLDTVVLSAGPDGRVDSPFAVDGLPTRADDVVALVSVGGRGR